MADLYPTNRRQGFILKYSPNFERDLLMDSTPLTTSLVSADNSSLQI